MECKYLGWIIAGILSLFILGYFIYDYAQETAIEKFKEDINQRGIYPLGYVDGNNITQFQEVTLNDYCTLWYQQQINQLQGG